MRALVQRVSAGSVTVDGAVISSIAQGFVVLLGVREGDGVRDAEYLADKCLGLRIFEDPAGKMNLSIAEAGGSMLIVSQFTLYADARKGNRPSFVAAARPEIAEPLYRHFVDRIAASLGASRVGTGLFGAMMCVTIVNDGPVTILIESPATSTIS